MFRAPLKRALSLAICLVMLATTGCAAMSASTPAARSERKQLAEMVASVQQDVIPDLKELTDWQLTETAKMLEEKKACAERGEIYVAPDNSEQIAAYKAMCEAHLAAIDSDAAALALLTKLDSATAAAGQEYFRRMQNAIQSLVSIMVFDKDVKTAQEPVTTFNTRTFTDDASKINALYEALKQCVDSMRTVDCPSFMQQTYDKYTSTCATYITFLEQWVNAISLGDNLRYTAANNMYTRTQIFEDKYSTSLTDDFNLQYQKTAERLDGNITTLADEIISSATMSGKELENFVYSYTKDAGKIDVSCDGVETIYPSMYNSMDSILNFTAISDSGDKDVIIDVEIPGFTQKYSEKITLTPQVAKIYVHPPLLTGDLDLSSAKDAQIEFTMTSADGGQVIDKQTLPVRIMSKYDIEYYNDEFGMATRDNYLCFLTPESESIVSLKRAAIDEISELTDGAMESFPGYQNVLEMDSGYEYYNTYYQVLGIQCAMSDLGVRYNLSPYSSSGTQYLQRVLLPSDVIDAKSGLCVETALVMASALQSANMHAMLLFPTGHAQVAVETWTNSGEYFLIETTLLPVTSSNFKGIVTYMDADEWADYITNGTDGNGCYVVDCDDAKLLGLSAMSN